MNIFDRAVEYAKQTMVSDGNLMPVLMAYTSDEVIVIPMAKLFGENRDMTIADLLTIYFLLHGVTSYVLMHEAMLRHEPANGGKPRKVEAVMVVEVGREHQSVSVHEVVRGQGISIVPFPLKPGNLTGKLTSLLPKDDFTTEDVMFEIAESIVNAMGSKRLPLRYA